MKVERAFEMDMKNSFLTSQTICTNSSCFDSFESYQHAQLPVVLVEVHLLENALLVYGFLRVCTSSQIDLAKNNMSGCFYAPL